MRVLSIRNAYTLKVKSIYILLGKVERFCDMHEVLDNNGI